MNAAFGPERLPPLPTHQLTPEQQAICASVRSTPARAGLKGAGQQRLGGFIDALLRRPPVLRAALQLSDSLRVDALLPMRLKELAILCIARHHDGHYAWAQHETLAVRAGVPPPTVEAIRRDLRPDGMANDEAAVHDFVREWLRHEFIADDTYLKLQSQLTDEAIAELMAVVGYFRMGVTILNAARVALPEGAQPLPPRRVARA